jgi:hypothetical protein
MTTGHRLVDNNLIEKQCQISESESLVYRFQCIPCLSQPPEYSYEFYLHS